MNREKRLTQQRRRRQRGVRRRMNGTADRPRLAVFRSLKHIGAQVIDDELGRTIVSCSTLDEAVRAQVSYGGNKAAAKVVGVVLARRVKDAGIQRVCFDRRHYKFHGRVKELADAARAGGIDF